MLGTAPNQLLTCTAVDLGPCQGQSVHITSATTANSCGAYDNTASLLATNAPALTADASTTVRCSGVEGVPPVTVTPPTTGPLASTGAPLRAEAGWALLLVGLGGLFLLAGPRRRRTH